MKRFALLLPLVVSAAAQAQLTYHGTQINQISNGSAFVGDYSGTATFESPNPVQYRLNVQDVWSMQLDRASTSLSSEQDQLLYFSTGNLPVELSNLNANFNGKVVYSGGDANTVLDASFRAGTFIYEFEDTNGNNIYDNNEAAYLVLNTDVAEVTTLSFNGYSFYDVDLSFNVSTYVLNPYSNYVAILASGFFDPSFDLGTGPNVFLTNEYVNPDYNGHTITFDAQAVPEPATLALLGIPALAALRRKKSKV